MTNNIHTARTPEEFYKCLRNAEEELEGQTHKMLKDKGLCKKPEIWYRGHASDEYELLPSLFRLPETVVGKELELFDEFSRLWNSEQPETKSKEWLQLFKMQHLFIPTRLLDWSESSGIALYFSLKEDLPNQPCLFLFSPILLHLALLEANPMPKMIAELPPKFRDYVTDQMCKPIAIKPPRKANDRIERQKGCFTLHANRNEALFREYPHCFEKIIITRDAAIQLRMRVFRETNEFDIYPDEYGLRQHLIQHFNLDGHYDRMIAEEIYTNQSIDYATHFDSVLL